MSAVARALVSLVVAVAVSGCSTQHPGPESPGLSPGDKGHVLSVEPTLDPDSGLWLSDGWPVPAPGATFDPDAPWMTASEASQRTATCLADKGWNIEIERPGEFTAMVPPGQESAHQADYKACLIEHRIGIQPAPPVNPQWAEREYAAQTKARACLVDEGYAVPELPSYRVYEDEFLSGGTIDIYSLARNAGVDFDEDPSIYQRCPDPMDSWGHN